MKKILISLLICILMITLVSAFDFDNVKNVKETYGKAGYKDIEIINLFGLGDILWSGTVDYNTEICNRDCNSTQTITLHEKGSLIDEVIFKTLQDDGSWVEQPIRSSQVYVDGKLYELGTEINPGTYEVRLDGQKKPIRTIEWIYKTQGIFLEEWASWGTGAAEWTLLYNFSTTGANADPHMIASNGTNVWITDGDINIYNYYVNGTDIDSFDISGTHGANIPLGITVNDTFLWITRQTEDEAYKYNMAGASQGVNFDTSAKNADMGIAMNTSHFWIIEPAGNIHMYTSVGVFVSSIDISGNTTTARGLELDDDGYLYFIGQAEDMAFKWHVNGSYTDEQDLTFAGIDDPQGIAHNDTAYFVVDEVLDKVFVFVKEETSSITLNSPADNFISILSEVEFNATVTLVEGINLVNVSYWDNSTGVFKLNQTNSSIDPETNTTTFNATFGDGYYSWNIQACDSDHDCAFSGPNQTLRVSGIRIESQTYNTSVFETASEVYSINVTARDSNLLTAANLIWNGTSYAGTQSGTVWSRNIDIPTPGNLNKSFYWDFTYDGNTISSDTNTVQINETNFSNCGGIGGSTLFLNISFKDESEVVLNASIPTSNYVYYLGGGTSNKTFTFINISNDYSYPFCAFPNQTLNVIPYVQYKHNATYPQRIWNPSVQQYTNLTTNQTLYLLSSVDGIYVTFQVINAAEQPIEDVVVTGTRTIGGETVTVAYGTTGKDGGVTFWLNPDFSHTFTFVATGFETFITTLTPTQSSYTIQLGVVSDSLTDFSKGISYVIRPRTTELFNDTTYNFNYTLSSSFYTVTEFGFRLRLQNGSILGSTSASTNGGIVSLNQNTVNYSSIIMDYYYVITGNYTNSSRYWTVYNTELTQWSIRTFFTDLNTYLSAGMFGLDDFGLHLIVYIIIFVSVGIMSFKYGLTSPIAISTIIFGVIYFFDVVVELLPNPIDAITHFPTLASAVILVVLILKEVMR